MNNVLTSKEIGLWLDFQAARATRRYGRTCIWKEGKLIFQDTGQAIDQQPVLPGSESSRHIHQTQQSS